MSNKFDSQTLNDFYKYCEENPKAKEAVDTVIKAFSPDKIQTFIENCIDVPLPTDAVSYDEFCLKYEMQLRKVQETPKQETVVVEDKTVIARHDFAVAKDKTVVAGNTVEKQEIAEKRQEILTILTP